MPLLQENVLISAARNRRGMDLQDTVVAAKAVYNSWFTPEFVLGNLHTFVSLLASIGPQSAIDGGKFLTGRRSKSKRKDRDLGMASGAR